MSSKALTAEERAQNVQRVRDAADRLAAVEKKLLHALAVFPSLVREVMEVRTEIDEALRGAPREGGGPP